MTSIAKLVNFYSATLDALAIPILTQLEAKYGKPYCGRNRATFFSKHCVIKFPLNLDGLTDNQHEAKRNHSVNYYAKGRAVLLGDFNCVVQEKLTMPKSYDGFPSWVMSIDCGQVGYDCKGQLKAYDFGLC